MSQSTDSGRDEAPAQDGLVIHLAKDDVARKRFLKMAGKTMGSAAAAASLTTFIAACGSSNSSSGSGATSTSASGSSSSDLKIVNYALTLEYLEATFYKEVIASGLFSKSPALPTIKQFGREEADHVKALISTANELGGAVKAPKTKFPLDKGATYITQLAATVENLGAAAYLGQAPLIKDPKVLAAALAIHTVEARHAAVLNLTLKMSPTPDGAFGEPKSMAEVLKVASQFIVS